MKNILVVEDDLEVSSLVCDVLKDEGFSCQECRTIEEARSILRAKKYDFLIIDVGLPDGSGFDLCRKIREYSHIPILFLTARSHEIDRVVGFEVGGDDYVTKPFSPRELVARIKAIDRRSSKKKRKKQIPKRTELPFHVDDQRHKIKYHDQVLNLSLNEFLILKILIEHPGWVFTREKLMKMAWKDPQSSDVRTVDTHIKTIRAKLKAITPDLDPIITSRGVGYSLKEK